MMLRGLPIAECCHPLWGDFRRSLGKASLTGTLLKARLVIVFEFGVSEENFVVKPVLNTTNTTKKLRFGLITNFSVAFCSETGTSVGLSKPS